ncbi:MAG: right-handed parallel beta-helix repeat-containing protein [Gammaproteobacteria bacterium]|nr:right-handed parallel beta-helix repeat-containing protein [Gammaproteobacteria bacterium]
MVSSTDRRKFLRRTAAVVVTGLASPLISCTARSIPTARGITTGRFYAYSRNAVARPAGAVDEEAAIRSAFGDVQQLSALLQPGDTVVLPDDHYPLVEPVRIVDGVEYRAATGSSTRPLLDARGRLDFCVSGVGTRDSSIEGLHCINARKNGIDIKADPKTGRMPANVSVRACECSSNGREATPSRLWHEDGNGISIHCGRRYGTRLEATTSGIVVEDCEAHDNLHAGILIDLPGVGHRISRCKAGGNGRGAGTNSWAILVRPSGGAMLKGWTPSRHAGVWKASAPRYVHQVPVRIVCSRHRSSNRGRWKNIAWDLTRTRGDQRRPGRGEFGFAQSGPRYHPELFVNLGPVKQFRLVICWIGDCHEPLIEDCTAWDQGGVDGVGIGFDQNTIDGVIRGCTSHANRVGFSLHINRGGTMSDNVAFRNRAYGFDADRNLGILNVTGNTAYENATSDFYFALFEENGTRLDLTGNRAYSGTGYLGAAYKAPISARARTRQSNLYCGEGRSSSGLPAFPLESGSSGCER